jgi:peptide-methionine (S)-S-oxide reductase
MVGSTALKLRMPRPEDALAGRDETMPVADAHFVNGNRISPPFPAGLEQAIFGMGCFWGAERKFWEAPGVYATAVGYAGGYTPNPSYREVCSGMTGHTEVVLVVFDPTKTSYEALLRTFWENHDPTQGMRQGNDAGTQYRSAIYTFSPEQKRAAGPARATNRPVSDASPPKSRTRRRFTMPRTTTSNTSRKILAATVASAERASAALLASYNPANQKGFFPCL